MELRRYKLSQLITIKNGKDYKHLEEGEVPVFGSGGYMCSVSSYLYDKVSILLPRKGTLSNIQYFNNGKFWTVDTCFYSIINESLCDPYYLYRHLRSLDLSGFDTGASIPSMTQKTYNGIKVMLPSLPTQRRIASILSAYDNLIENNTRRIRLLEQMAENLYKEWFVRFRFPGHEKAEFENGLPKGWKNGSLGSVVEFQNGFAFKSETFKEDGKYSIVTIKNVQDSGFDGNNVDRIDEIPNRMPQYCFLKQGDILLSLTGNVGRVCRVFGNNYLLNQRVAKLKSDCDYYTYSLFKSEAIFAALNLISYGTAQLNLSPIKASRIKIVIPPNKERLLYNEKVRPIFKMIDSLIKENSLLSHQRDLLLPRLMSGKLEVNV